MLFITNATYNHIVDNNWASILLISAACYGNTKSNMFENLINNLKTHTSNLTDNIKTKSKKFSLNIDSLKERITNKQEKTSYYSPGSIIDDNDYYNNDFLSPRAYNHNGNSKWPEISHNMEWVPYVPPTLDEFNIVDRFIKVITINDDDNRRTDREEIRRRLAMGNEDDYYGACDRPGRKPSLQARLQSGMNLQICFMNETASDTDSPSSDSEHSPGMLPSKVKPSPKQSPRLSHMGKMTPAQRPVTLALGGHQPQSLPHALMQSSGGAEMDFFAKQARLQTEARMALAQAKEMARMQMEIEKQRQKKSPITEMVRHSLEKVGIPFPEDRRRLSRQILTEMNVAQLQVIVNDLHTQIEILNESLVKFLMDRDDLHMEQDSMLVDIEDLTRFLGAKEQTIKEQSSLLTSMPTISVASTNNNNGSSTAPASPLAALNVRPHLHRIASLVKNK